MNDTQTPADRPAAHVAAGVIAVMQHLIDHGLSAPIDIVPNTRFIRVFVPNGTYTAWCDSLTVDTEDRREYALPDIGVQWTAAGRLPGNGVRVEVSGFMPAERFEVA